MMALLFLILLIAFITAWFGARREAIYFYSATMVVSVLWFFHHVSSHLSIQL